MKYKVIFALIAGLIFGWDSSHAQEQNTVHEIILDNNIINPTVSEYIGQAIDRATAQKAQALIIKMDTPGGLLESTREIVKKMLVSKVPIIVYISPNGSRAGSAGVFITYASHLAAMAPSTNIGAAHPVNLGGDQPKPDRDNQWKQMRELLKELKDQRGSKEFAKKDAKKPQPTLPATEKSEPEIEYDEHPMESKILNDTVAFIKSIARERNRNVEWAVESVTKSSSITGQEALEKKVVEIIATDEKDLLNQADGRIVKIAGENITLRTKDASIEVFLMDFRQNFFNVLANPNIAYILMILGFYGLLFEITHPGAGVPGILGAIFLIIAFYSMQTLPTNYAGVALMALGFVLFIAELFTPGIGLLALGGLVALGLGSLLLFQSADPFLRVSIVVIISTLATTALFVMVILRKIFQSQRRKPSSGMEGLVGAPGEARTPLGPGKKGKVFIHGELWNAESDEDIEKGELVIITKVSGLTLKVKRK